MATENRTAEAALLERRRPHERNGSRLGGLKSRLTGGDSGSLSIVIGLVVVWATFQTLNGQFLSPDNLFNLARQISYGGVVTLGLVLALLIREIDLSVGSIAGFAGAVLGLLVVNEGWSPYLGILAVVLMGAALGSAQGLVRTFFGVPSFIVTLGGLLVFFGLQLRALGDVGSIRFPFGETISQIQAATFPAGVSFALATVAVGAYAAALAVSRLRHVRASLPTHSWTGVGLRVTLLAVCVYPATWVLTASEGVPLSFAIFVGLAVLVWWLTTQTRYGHHLYAVGGNPEAAHRAGINLTAIRVTVFALSGALAAFGGVLSVSYVGAASAEIGGSTLLLYAIAAAVIGGTSLFGGYGSAWSALLGWLVIGSIYNGMYLLSWPSDVQNVVIGLVLIVAVVVDSLTRRGREREAEL